MDHCVVSVWDLQPSVQEFDIKKHFSDILPDCQPKVSLLTTSPNSVLQAATVVFSHPSGQHVRKDALKKLQNVPLKDERGGSSQIILSDRFLGLTVLAQSCPDPAFE
jgi:hypothetical protein